MKLTQIRYATVLLEYAGVRFLIDPMLSPTGTLPPCHIGSCYDIDLKR